MAEQTKQDIQDALLRIHAEHPEDWNAFEQASRQVLAEMGTQRAHEENQAVLDTTQGEADIHSSETNSAQNDPRVAMATASSRASAHANVSETHIRPYRCTVPGCGKRYQHVRSRYRHYQEDHHDCLKMPTKLETAVANALTQAQSESGKSKDDVMKMAHSFAGKYLKKNGISATDALHRCEFDGCERAYENRSSLNRHYKKDHDGKNPEDEE
ncbi:hypothetical protein K4K58_004836 [Colletotrichum sp. SAR11_239]|nr:hypothetical protein K4K58_004836 [Colletotrichum sp. SAR11_239]